MAYWELVCVQALPGHRLQCEFKDGTRGVVAINPAEFYGALEPLADERFFAQVRIDAYGAPCWPGDIDIAPDGLYRDLKRQQAA